MMNSIIAMQSYKNKYGMVTVMTTVLLEDTQEKEGKEMTQFLTEFATLFGTIIIFAGMLHQGMQTGLLDVDFSD